MPKPFQLLICLIPLLFSTCGRRDVSRPHAPVIVITVDTLRSDHLPIYGYDKVRTPAFDSFARDAVLFERAYAQSPMTLPSHATILTGLLPPRHGVRENVGFKLASGETTLAEAMKAKGRPTGAVVSSMVLRRSTGMSQGFDFYDDHLGPGQRKNVRSYQERSGAQSIERAKTWLADHSRQPFFFWLHLYEPHTPYNPPQPFRDRYPHPYDGEIAYTDSLLQDFFAFLEEQGIYERAVIFLVSDHGEGLGDHGEAEHGLFTYREAVQVPFLVKLPEGERAGTRIAAPAGLVDLMPTALDLVDLPLQASDGVSLFSGEASAARDLYCEAKTGELFYGWFSSRSVIHDELHYMEGYEPELYDLAADPSERNNLFGSRKIPGSATRLMDRMSGGKSETDTISDEDKELLESLGYTGGFEMGDSARSLTPTAFLETYHEVTRAQRLINEKRYVDAERILSGQLERYPAMIGTRVMLGHLLNLLKKHKAAEYVCLEGLAAVPNHQGLLLSLISAELALKKREEAIRMAERCIEAAPVLCGRKLVLLFMEAGDYQQGAHYAETMLVHDPTFAFGYYVLARVARDPDGDSQVILDKAIALHGKDLDPEQLVAALFFLGDSLARVNRYQAAMPAFRAAIERNPGHAATRMGLSKLYASLHKPREAIAVLDEWVANYPTRANYLQAAATMDEIGIEQAARFYRNQAQKYKD